MKTKVLAAVALLALGASGMASAVTISDSLGGCSVTDVTNAGFNANSCLGLFAGNDSLSGITDLYGSGYSLLGKSDEPGAVSTSGGNWTAIGLTAYSDFVVSLKQADFWATYFFSPVHGTTGTWSTTGWAAIIGNPAGGLSHLSVYVKGTSSVPEPATLALLGAGLLGMAGAVRRRKLKA